MEVFQVFCALAELLKEGQTNQSSLDDMPTLFFLNLQYIYINPLIHSRHFSFLVVMTLFSSDDIQPLAVTVTRKRRDALRSCFPLLTYYAMCSLD